MVVPVGCCHISPLITLVNVVDISSIWGSKTNPSLNYKEKSDQKSVQESAVRNNLIMPF